MLYGELARTYVLYINDATQITRINQIKGFMLKMQREHSSRSRLLHETYMQGEPTSIFHLTQKNSKRTIIRELEVDGAMLQDTTQIEQKVVEYFETLFSEDTISHTHATNFNPTRRIPENDDRNDSIMNATDTDAILQCIKQSCGQTSSGEDGLPKEFYVKAWDIIRDEFTLVIK